MALLRCSTCSVIGGIVVPVLAYFIGALLPTPPKPAGPDVARLDSAFHEAVGASGGLSIGSKGFFLRDRDTLFWKLFTDKFGANPNTPYMCTLLAALGPSCPCARTPHRACSSSALSCSARSASLASRPR